MMRQPSRSGVRAAAGPRPRCFRANARSAPGIVFPLVSVVGVAAISKSPRRRLHIAYFGAVLPLSDDADADAERASCFCMRADTRTNAAVLVHALLRCRRERSPRLI